MTDALAAAVLNGERRALAKAITLLESRRLQDRPAAEALLEALIPNSGKSVRVGISGPPGVGKSTFIEALGRRLVAGGHRLAVLAIDPSSPVTGGSILGDRVRMEELSKNAQVFIRPSPSGATLGGVARHTREAVLAVEAGGYDVVLVETVGVGQSETVVHSLVDIFLTLHLPHSGDEIQGMKKGILELADLVAVTKADGGFATDAKHAQRHLTRALGMVHHGPDGPAPVLLVSSTEGTGIGDVWHTILDLIEKRKARGDFAKRRAEQAIQWFRSELGESLMDRLKDRKTFAAKLAKAETAVRKGGVAASVAASWVLDEVLD